MDASTQLSASTSTASKDLAVTKNVATVVHGVVGDAIRYSSPQHLPLIPL